MGTTAFAHIADDPSVQEPVRPVHESSERESSESESSDSSDDMI